MNIELERHPPPPTRGPNPKKKGPHKRQEKEKKKLTSYTLKCGNFTKLDRNKEQLILAKEKD